MPFNNVKNDDCPIEGQEHDGGNAEKGLHVAEDASGVQFSDYIFIDQNFAICGGSFV